MFGIAKEVKDDNQKLWRLMKLTDGTRKVSEIEVEMLKLYPSLDESAVRNALIQLYRNGLIEEVFDSKRQRLNAYELDRYSRNLQFFSLISNDKRDAIDYMYKLKNSTVAIAGMGGIGASVAASFASMGIGKIYCIDFDTVEYSNLTRQILYGEEDVGKSKVMAAANNIKKINSSVEVEGVERQLKTTEDFTKIMKKCDIFINGIDFPVNIALKINDAALLCGTPWINTGYDGPRFGISMFIPFKTPCYVCLQHYSETKRIQRNIITEEYLYKVDEVIEPIISPVSNMAGHLAAFEGMLFLLGIPCNTAGKLYLTNLFDITKNTTEEIPVWNKCPSCGGLNK
ncbi:MAG: HesA/MoeB/ThiF family protein [Thermoplasmataceae archaeon]